LQQGKELLGKIVLVNRFIAAVEGHGHRRRQLPGEILAPLEFRQHLARKPLLPHIRHGFHGLVGRGQQVAVRSPGRAQGEQIAVFQAGRPEIGRHGHGQERQARSGQPAPAAGHVGPALAETRPITIEMPGQIDGHGQEEKHLMAQMPKAHGRRTGQHQQRRGVGFVAPPDKQQGHGNRQQKRVGVGGLMPQGQGAGHGQPFVDVRPGHGQGLGQIDPIVQAVGINGRGRQ